MCPWETLAANNHGFLLCDRRRFFPRDGGLLYTEDVRTRTPSSAIVIGIGVKETAVA